VAAVVHGPERIKGDQGVDIDHTGPEKCTDCGQDAYIRLAGTEDFVCAHCFSDRGRKARKPKDLATAWQSPRTGSAGGAAR
jgi:ribosomal protein L37E